MNQVLDRGVLIGVGLVATLLVLNAALGFRNIRQINTQSDWVTHTQEVLQHSQRVLQTLLDAETGQRGYLVTLDDKFLVPYQTALPQITTQIDRLAAEVRDNPAQQARVQKLHEQALKRIELLSSGIDLKRANAATDLLNATLRAGRDEMDSVRLLIAELQTEERTLLEGRAEASRGAYQFAQTSAVAGALLGLVLVGGCVVLLDWNLRAKQAADKVIHQQREWLQTTLSSIGDGVIAADTQGNVTFLNPVAATLTGWSGDTPLGQPLPKVFNIINEDSRATVENPALRALKEGMIVGLANHTLLISRDGTEHPIDDSAAPIRNADGTIDGAVLVFRDITERKAEERQRSLQASMAEVRADVSATLAQFLDLGAILQDCVEVLCEGMQLASTQVWLLEDAGQVLELAARAGNQPEPVDESVRVDLGQFLVGRIVQSRQFYQTNSAASDPGIRNPEWVQVQQIVAFAGYPLMLEDRAVGVLAIHSRRPLQDAEFEDLRLISESIAQCIERKRAETALREGEAQFRALANSIPQLAWSANPDGSIAWYNHRWYEYTGKSAAEMLGWGWQSIHDAKELPRVVEKFKHHIVQGLDWEDTFPLRRHDGEMRWHLSRALPVRDQNGVVVRWFGTNTDITEERLREAAQQARTDQLQQVAEIATKINAALDVNTVLGVITEGARTIIGAHQCVTTITADVTGHRAVHSVSMSDKYATWRGHDAIPDGLGFYSLIGDYSQPLRMTQTELESHSAWPRFQSEAEKYPPMRGWLAAPLIGRQGRNIGLIQLSDRNTGEFTQDDESILVQLAQVAAIAIENARLYSELRDGDRRKDEFLATLAHELRNPLAPIRNALQIMRLSDGGSRPLVDVREMMERQLGQMVRLVDDLLDVSRITRGKIELQQEPLDVKWILESAVETSQPLMEAAQHQLTVDLPDQPLWITGDRIRLAQVVANLLNNAAKYTPQGGSIRLSAKAVDQHILISVADNGIGIPAPMLAKVFDMFTQVDRSLDRAQGGLGIGLTLVRRLVEMHGGTVDARSAGQGQGSEFTLRLPKASPGLKPVLAAPAPAPAALGSIQTRRVLVVDDSEDSARSLSLLLNMLGHSIRTVNDGPAALDAAREFQPDLVLLDIGLPGMNGYEVARRLREIPSMQTAVLVAQTGWGQAEDRQRSTAAGFDEHLVKPIDPMALEKLLRSLDELRKTND